jgi:hypothetical protein
LTKTTPPDEFAYIVIGVGSPGTKISDLGMVDKLIFGGGRGTQLVICSKEQGSGPLATSRIKIEVRMVRMVRIICLKVSGTIQRLPV